MALGAAGAGAGGICGVGAGTSMSGPGGLISGGAMSGCAGRDGCGGGSGGWLGMHGSFAGRTRPARSGS